MNGGYAQSSVPLVAMIVIDGVFAALISASFVSSRWPSSASMRSRISRSSASLSSLSVLVSISIASPPRWWGGIGRSADLLLLQVEGVGLVLFRRRQECVPGLRRERLHVLDRAGVGRHDLQHLARRELVQRLRSEEHTSELQSRRDLVCRLL